MRSMRELLVRERRRGSLDPVGLGLWRVSRMKRATCGPTRWTRVLPIMMPILKILGEVIAL